jgi:hypothetical protein
VKYFSDASGGLVSHGADGALSRYRGWQPADDLTPQALAGVDWFPVGAAEAVELRQAIHWMPARPVV